VMSQEELCDVAAYLLEDLLRSKPRSPRLDASCAGHLAPK
jgi:hypothetical protein